ncbi:hypothetical protein [Streptomyces sp. ISL-94]|uniref:hypothetical protein n=1 Tax=Streptomyces sp. ISL-94 TaxID=2819190 RepID=UPI001BEB29C8|nr:hypothetical protein [Streptomyces sp. ISL-94]MBT2481679.1 hypothetical protein [Streptomyces sp. ISL-94]
MSTDPEYADYIAALTSEHRDLAAFLTKVDLSSPFGANEFRGAMDELHHIAKDEDGLFPASLTALAGDEWDRSLAGWRTAHPDHELHAAG